MVERITPEEAYEKVRRGEAVLLDVRRGSWNESDVKAAGAIRIPPDEVEDHLDELPKDKEIIAYCTWTNEATSASVAQTLNEHGFKAKALFGGFEAWEEAGLPVESKTAGAKAA